MALLLTPAAAQHSPRPTGDLKVAADGHSLEMQDGTPFYWLGDTAWNYFYALDDEAAEQYASHRQAQGFNVVLVQLVGGEPNALDRRGQSAILFDEDRKASLNPAFASRAGDKIRILNRHGIIAGVVLAWKNILPLLFGDVQSAERFGRDVGRSLGDTNVIWLLGGDVNPTPEQIPLWQAVARGLRAGSPRPHLMSYHPTRGSSSAWFGEDDLLDFQSAQSGHSRYRPLSQPVVGPIRSDFARVPSRPVIDLESGYEGIPDGLYRLHPRGTNVVAADRLDAYDIRVRVWQQYVSGAFGYTYGQFDVITFWMPGQKVAWPIGQRWTSQMDAPGARQLSLYQAVRRSLGAPYLVPDDSLIRDSNAKLYDNARTLAGCTASGHKCLVYSASGMPFTVSLQGRSAGTRFTWIDPRTGAHHLAKPTMAEADGLLFTPAGKAFQPKQGERSMNDWLLLLESE